MSMGFENEDSHKKRILLSNIQRFSLHDGPGIRTTVFLKGCSICCPWCSNPENIKHEVQIFKKDGVCGEYGQWYSLDELYDEVIKDKAFYGNYGDEDNGGVTFSGGECMLQMKEMEPLLQRLKVGCIHTAVETSLFCPPEQLSIAVAYIDLFYVDIKLIDDERCRRVLGGRIATYRGNLKTLLDSGKPIILRIPVIGGYTDDVESRRDTIKLIKECTKTYGSIQKVEILKEHDLGLNKYYSLHDGGNQIIIPEYKGVSDELIKLYKDEIEKEIYGAIPVELCKI